MVQPWATEESTTAKNASGRLPVIDRRAGFQALEIVRRHFDAISPENDR
jgi:hypothetical protein